MRKLGIALFAVAVVLMSLAAAKEVWARGAYRGGGYHGSYHGSYHGGEHRGYEPREHYEHHESEYRHENYGYHESPSYNRSPSLSRTTPYRGDWTFESPSRTSSYGTSTPSAHRGTIASGPGLQKPSGDKPGEHGAIPSGPGLQKPSHPVAPDHPIEPGPKPGPHPGPHPDPHPWHPHPWHPQPIPPHQIINIQNNFGGWGWFGPHWYHAYPGAWAFGGIAASAWWVPPVWTSTCGWYGGNSTPWSYDYGANITYNDNEVYYDGKPVATTEQYYDQASSLADNGGEATTDAQWQPLGVYTVVRDDQSASDKTLQLAIDKNGLIRGNFYDALTDEVTQVEGAVDKATNRVAFRPVGNDKLVIECGLWNLSQETSPVLIHFGKDRTDQRMLVRLTPPKSDESQNQTSDSDQS